MATFGDTLRLRTPIDFGAVVRDRRSKLGMSQASLARKVGVGRQWIVELEKGKSGAPLALVLRTLDALGIVLQAREGPRKTQAAAASKGVDIDHLLENLRRKKS